MGRLALTLAAALAAAGAPVAAGAQTVILVRHAEKADASSDPELSAAGAARAQALAASLAQAGVTHVFTTQYKRTKATAAASAAQAGVTAREIRGNAETVAAVKAAGASATVLVVGHSNTVPQLAAALGDPAPPAIPDSCYDTLVVIRLGGPTPAAVHGRYGAPTAC